MGRDGAVQDSAFRMSKTADFPPQKSPVDCLSPIGADSIPKSDIFCRVKWVNYGELAIDR